MAFRDFFITNKAEAEKNNYKLELFQSISNNAKNEILGFSTIKKYFNNLYDNGNNSFTAFSVDQKVDDSYAAEITNKIRTFSILPTDVYVQ